MRPFINISSTYFRIISFTSRTSKSTFSVKRFFCDVKINQSLSENFDENKAENKIFMEHDVDTSIRYLKSKAYEITYKGAKVWEPYRRNHKGSIPPEKTRKTCIRSQLISTGNPCPICRDEYLVLHPRNVNLLKQFISPFTGEVLSYSITGVCQKQYFKLLISVEQAWDLGYLKMPIPFRTYDYSLYGSRVGTTTKC